MPTKFEKNSFILELDKFDEFNDIFGQQSDLRKLTLDDTYAVFGNQSSVVLTLDYWKQFDDKDKNIVLYNILKNNTNIDHTQSADYAFSFLLAIIIISEYSYEDISIFLNKKQWKSDIDDSCITNQRYRFSLISSLQNTIYERVFQYADTVLSISPILHSKKFYIDKINEIYDQRKIDSLNLFTTSKFQTHDDHIAFIAFLRDRLEFGDSIMKIGEIAGLDSKETHREINKLKRIRKIIKQIFLHYS